MRPPISASYQPALRAPASVLALIGLFLAVHIWRQIHPAGDDGLFLLFSYLPFRADLPVENWMEQGARYWTPVTYALIHADWTHLGLNSLWMLAFGSPVARRLGAPRFLLFSALCAIAGALAYGVLHAGERAVLIGASAAISGHMAGAVRLIYAGGASLGAMGDPRLVRPLTLQELFRNQQALIFLGMWAGLNLLFGAGSSAFGSGADNIAWESHFGGFIAGLLLFGILDPQRARAR